MEVVIDILSYITMSKETVELYSGLWPFCVIGIIVCVILGVKYN